MWSQGEHVVLEIVVPVLVHHDQQGVGNQGTASAAQGVDAHGVLGGVAVAFAFRVQRPLDSPTKIPNGASPGCSCCGPSPSSSGSRVCFITRNYEAMGRKLIAREHFLDAAVPRAQVADELLAVAGTYEELKGAFQQLWLERMKTPAPSVATCSGSTTPSCRAARRRRSWAKRKGIVDMAEVCQRRKEFCLRFFHLEVNCHESGRR